MTDLPGQKTNREACKLALTLWQEAALNDNFVARKENGFLKSSGGSRCGKLIWLSDMRQRNDRYVKEKQRMTHDEKRFRTGCSEGMEKIACFFRKTSLPERRLVLVVFSLCTAFLFLLFSSKSSPLYPMNDWEDCHCFFTLGRGIRHGMVPYRDLYEQKGPFLYFLYYLAACISETSFTGVFMIEWILFSGFIFESVRIIRLWTNSFFPLILLPLVLYGITSSPAFFHGCSAEEFCLPVLLCSLEISLSACRRERNLSFGEAFLTGICAGICFLVKYTFCGFYIGLGTAHLIRHFHRRQFRSLFSIVSGAIAGFSAILLPFLLWYAYVGGLEALIQAYLYNNITMYSASGNLLSRAISVAYNLVRRNGEWFLPALAGMCWFLWHWKQEMDACLCTLLSVVFLLASAFGGGVAYTYYYLILCVYAPLGLIPLSRLLEKHFALRLRGGILLSVCLSVVCMAVAAKTGRNTYLVGVAKENLPQYVFAERMSVTKDTRLLNYGFLDGGFYYASGVLPESRYFCQLNIPLVEMVNEQRKLVIDGAIDYVVTRNQDSLPGDHYRKIAESTFYYEGVDQVYTLFEKRGLSQMEE